MSSILGLLVVGAVISTAIKVGVLIVGVNVYRARQRHNEAQAVSSPTDETPTAVVDQPNTVASVQTNPN